MIGDIQVGDPQIVLLSSGYASVGQVLNVKIALAQDTIKTIDSKYLPDDIGILPPVTTNDNGKIIEVVDGAYVLKTFEESSFKTYIDAYINSALAGGS